MESWESKVKGMLLQVSVGSLIEQTLPLGTSSEQGKDCHRHGTDILACRRETIHVCYVGATKEEEEEISEQVKGIWNAWEGCRRQVEESAASSGSASLRCSDSSKALE